MRDLVGIELQSVYVCIVYMYYVQERWRDFDELIIGVDERKKLNFLYIIRVGKWMYVGRWWFE